MSPTAGERRNEARFWAKVTPPVNQCDCWLWRGSIEKGYGVLRSSAKPYPLLKAYRFSYEMHKGPIPAGLCLDHLCRVTACVNPDHLEAVTHAVNVMRGYGPPAMHARATRCPRGHEYAGANLIVRKNGRGCRACQSIYHKALRAKRKARRALESAS